MRVIGEVLVIGIEVCAQTMVVVEHGGHTVKTEAVKVILSHPEFQVAQQEVEHTGLAVVKALGVPGRMIAFGTVVEELPGGTVEHVDALGGVLHRMGVDHVQQNPQSQLMGLVHQIFQILGLAEPGRGGIEAGHLIAEGAVVRMLHNGHELHRVISGFFDLRQNLVCKFPVGADFPGFLGHTYMGFVNVQFVLSYKFLIRPGKCIPVIYNFAGKGNGFGVLHHPAGVQRDMFRAGHVGIHNGLYLTAFPQGIIALQVQLPVTVAHMLQRVTGFVPAVEVALQIQLVCAGSPLPVVPAAVYMVKSIIIVCVGKIQ